jgi:DNA polymerase-4
LIAPDHSELTVSRAGGKPVIVVQTLTDSAVAIAASYPAKALGVKTGTLVREARQLCADVIAVQANHRLYTDYHDTS